MHNLRLGVNIDHVATIRNARGGDHPDPVRAALLAEKAGADGITAHLREDRRHISDEDIEKLKLNLRLPLNLEMAATPEMLEIAVRTKPNACCLVPEKRKELTTEGGLDVAAETRYLEGYIRTLKDNGIRVSLFIDANHDQIAAAQFISADIVEIHTGRYCESMGDEVDAELTRIQDAARYAAKAGLEVHAGHGLSFETVGAIATIPEIVELNIGHFLIGESIYIGLEESIKRMRLEMDRARLIEQP